MNIYNVYHKVTPNFMDNDVKTLGQEFNTPNTFRHVATVRCADVRDVFMLTNHIDSNWTENSAVVWSVGPNVRSTSVGDVILSVDVPECRWTIDGMGMREF